MTANDPVVAVVSDGSALPDQDTHVEHLLRRYSALIHDAAGLSTHVIPLNADDPQRLRTALRGLPPAVGVAFLPHVTADRAHVARLAAGETPVVTDHDTTAIALTAMVLTTLTRAGRSTGSGRVVIAGADTMPLLSPLLVAAEVGDITTWKRADAVAFPLHRIATGADVVIDLHGSLTAVNPTATPVVITRQDSRMPLLVLPGLLRAITQVRHARLDVDVYHACALALVMATPPELQLPDGPDRALARRVADAAIRAFHQTTPRPRDPRFG
ncbi:hypothetical protein [Actinocrispum wychmicini]|uniref:Uncharacterized protein n=1 Tax=Actinocrispum wychmicini TaxID=1213861 RepID=A0A4R2JXM1_9PSEU|nr:hypothetical protein [Actinocrispum wychmicini]TCO61939.1 hypothetical protein EV192_10276 [Actinocrispum wychmicini]